MNLASKEDQRWQVQDPSIAESIPNLLIQSAGTHAKDSSPKVTKKITSTREFWIVINNSWEILKLKNCKKRRIFLCSRITRRKECLNLRHKLKNKELSSRKWRKIKMTYSLKKRYQKRRWSSSKFLNKRGHSMRKTSVSWHLLRRPNR